MSVIRTSRGRIFSFENPEFDSDCIFEVAHALSRLCRFTGHTSGFYSVAEHSYWCSHMVPEKYALEALLHDGHEAYIGDVSSPLKKLLPDYRAVEQRVAAVFRRKFGLPETTSRQVDIADKYLAAIEACELLDWEDTPLTTTLTKCFDPDEACTVFMNRFNQLWSQ